ncbi:MAG: DEAD/DEAH box helicase [Pseudomonadota bacterium]
MTFSDLGLDADLLRAIDESGYTEPTPIQAAAIPHALRGRDVLGIAQTGTGKTASFTLPMIHLLSKGRARARMPRSLILCPTRELAAQVSENFEKYGKYHKLSMALLIGGVNFNNQDKLIDRGVDVLIATPGRLLDHFERGKLMLTGIQIMVVDEADRMLDMGFIPDIERIFGLTPFTRQTLFFSATMPPEITRITDTFLHNPERVEVARQATTAETVKQTVVRFKPSARDRADREKRECLRGLLQAEGEALTNAIIFCNRKRDVGVLQKSLEKHGFNAGAIHGDLDQSVRMATLNGFRDGHIALLVASDVAARGLDIPNVSHVFNFDVPTHAEDYVHRIGRTGRAGRSGAALTICAPSEQKYLDKIEEMIGQEIPKAEAPVSEAPEPAAEVPEKPRSRRRREEPREREERRPAASENRSRAGRSRGGRGRREDRDEPVIGLGDHVPAFLLREVKLPKKRTTTSNAKAAEEPETGGDTESQAA